MAPSDLVPAIWHGPFEGDRGPGVPPLKIGDVAEVAPEMLESGHWTAVSAASGATVAGVSTVASTPSSSRATVPPADAPGGDD